MYINTKGAICIRLVAGAREGIGPCCVWVNGAMPSIPTKSKRMQIPEHTHTKEVIPHSPRTTAAKIREGTRHTNTHTQKRNGLTICMRVSRTHNVFDCQHYCRTLFDAPHSSYNFPPRPGVCFMGRHHRIVFEHINKRRAPWRTWPRRRTAAQNNQLHARDALALGRGTQIAY